MNIIIWIVLGIIGGYIFTKLQSKVVATWKALIEKKVPEIKAIEDKVVAECAVDKEKFCWEKLWNGIVSLRNPTLWAKEFSWIFNLRKLVIVGVIIGVIYGVGWYQGQLGKRPVLDWHGKEEFVRLNEHYLHILKDGSMEVVDSDKKTVLKTIKVKDLENLRKVLRPYGLDIRMFVTAGGSLGTSGRKGEAGLGLQYFKWFNWHLNAFATSVGLYPVGVSYKLTDNFGILTGYGYGYKGDQRVYIGGKWNF